MTIVCDTVSLCRCSSVCHRWHRLVSDPLLWRRLCARPKWRLSRAAEQKQLLRFISSDGSINVSLYIFCCIDPTDYDDCSSNNSSFRGYSIKRICIWIHSESASGFRKNCILLTNLNPDSDLVNLLESHLTCDMMLAMSANNYK